MPAGLAELLGDHTALDTATAPTASVAWEPAASWFRAQPMTNLFPTCQHPQWCDSLNDPADTAKVQRALWAHQNPANCSSARHLVLESAYDEAAGLGSSLHIHMYFLALALTSDRILVASDDLRWGYAAPGLCEHDHAPGEDDAATYKNSSSPTWYIDCYFLPTTQCRLDVTKRRAAQVAPSLHEPHKVVRMRAAYSVHNTSCETEARLSALIIFERGCQVA